MSPMLPMGHYFKVNKKKSIKMENINIQILFIDTLIHNFIDFTLELKFKKCYLREIHNSNIRKNVQIDLFGNKVTRYVSSNLLFNQIVTLLQRKIRICR